MKKGVFYSLIALVLVLGLILPMAVPVLASEVTVTKNRVPDEFPYYEGETIHFVMTVTNPGNNTATNTLTRVWDTLPDGTVIEFLAANLTQVPGATANFTANYVVDWDDAYYHTVLGYWVVTNTFEVEGMDSLGDDVYGFTTSTTRVIPPEPVVGGEAFPIGRLSILAPWIVLGAAIIAGAAIVARRRQARS
jgi:uncharacterized repeat protein (TIGR01451 family)